MADELEAQTVENRSSEDRGGDDDDDGELEKLEVEVKQMAQKILNYRATLPDQFKKTFASILAAKRPVLPHFDDSSEAGTSGSRNPDAGEISEPLKTVSLAEDHGTADKTSLLKSKISSNISTMPVLLKRMKDCISRIDNLDASNGIIHPAFKRKRTS